MKKIQLLVLVLVLVAFGSCKKENQNQNSDVPKYVQAIPASYIAKQGDLQLKNMPDGAFRTFTLYTKLSPWYKDASGKPLPFALVRGDEFITGSAAQVWWHNPVNNENTFTIDQGIYANETPDWNVRQVCETKIKNTDNSVGQTAFLAMADFRPKAPLFPLTLNGYRLGDFLQMNAYDLTHLPGGENLSFEVKFYINEVDLAATKVKASLTGPKKQDAGKDLTGFSEFGWRDIVYKGAPYTSQSVFFQKGTLSSNADVTVYDGLVGKIVKVELIVTDNGTGGIASQSITKTIETIGGPDGLGGDGQSTLLKLTTAKQGWYDSATNKFTASDIEVHTTTVDFDKSKSVYK